MFIRNGIRFNIYASQTIDDTTYGDFTSAELRAILGITEISEPPPPEDYTEDTYYRVEQDDAPYVVYVMKSPEQLAALAARNLEKQKDNINAQRDLDINAGVTHAGKLWHSDDRFLTELIGMILGYQAGVMTGTQQIRTKENVIEELDLPQLIALTAAVGGYRKSVYAASWAAKDAL